MFYAFREVPIRYLNSHGLMSAAHHRGPNNGYPLAQANYLRAGPLGGRSGKPYVSPARTSLIFTPWVMACGNPGCSSPAISRRLAPRPCVLGRPKADNSFALTVEVSASSIRTFVDVASLPHLGCFLLFFVATFRNNFGNYALW